MEKAMLSLSIQYDVTHYQAPAGTGPLSVRQ